MLHGDRSVLISKPSRQITQRLGGERGFVWQFGAQLLQEQRRCLDYRVT
jgi:hypothetical protein